MTGWMLCLHGNWSFYSNFIDSCCNVKAQVCSDLKSPTPTFNWNKTNVVWGVCVNKCATFHFFLTDNVNFGEIQQNIASGLGMARKTMEMSIAKRSFILPYIWWLTLISVISKHNRCRRLLYLYAGSLDRMFKDIFHFQGSLDGLSVPCVQCATFSLYIS